jgi:uncharacterized membrane protein (DUF373 family)
MLSFLRRFQKIIVVSLIAMMVLTVFLATIELAWMLILDITTEPMFLLDIQELLDLFGLFLLVLIGIELIETLRTYLTDHEIHAEVVFTVALIAIGRKVIILDVKELPSLTLVGIAAIILAMSFGYFLLKYLRHHEKEDEAAGIIKKSASDF